MSLTLSSRHVFILGEGEDSVGFKCTSGECLQREKKCDGIAHCSDGSDEDKATSCADRYARVSLSLFLSYFLSLYQSEVMTGFFICF